MLELSGVSTFYGQFQALHEVALKVGDGQLVAMFGPNGHGKSTLLKTICGLVKPAAGTILFQGQDLSGLEMPRIVEMGLVYIAEDRHLFPEMSVLENLKMGAFNVHARTKEAENLEFVFELFPQLRALKGKAAMTLSGGEARMLAIGRGLMSDAKFLAVDEPSLGLAPKLRSEVFHKIESIRASGVSVLIVEQSTSQIADMADYIYLLEDGRIVYEGMSIGDITDENLKKVFLGIT
jgi:branched-chain amino acid transport system ATP-binding protein